MTREELKAHCLNQIEMCKTWAVGKGEEPSGKIYEEHKLILELLEQEPKWISVSERLPEIHQDVLLSLRSLDVVIGFRATTEPYFYCKGIGSCYIDTQNVLAWQPLSEPYKAESEVEE